jgi:hypothetical protein
LLNELITVKHLPTLFDVAAELVSRQSWAVTAKLIVRPTGGLRPR